MKVLHILDHSIPLHSGYTFRTRAILEQQRLLGWETFHVTSPKQLGVKESVEWADGFKFYRSQEVTGLKAQLPIVNQWAVVDALAKRLDQIIPEIKPDILHAHSPALNGLAAVKASKKFGIPLVYECRAFWEDAAVDHGSTTEGSLRYRLTHALETYVFKRANAVTTICEGLRLDIIGRGITEDKVTVIPNAVDIDKFTYGIKADPDLRGQLGLNDKIVLGFIGSFYAYEGIPLLLEAMPTLLEKSPNVRLLLVGGGPQESVIKQKTKDLNLNDHVIFTGRVPHDKVQDYYNQVDIFVYPRLPMRLTELVTPLKPLEAMAQGRLVVASDVGGHKELINKGQTGYLFEAGNAGNLTQTLTTLIDDRADWDRIRVNGRRFVEQERNWAASVGRYQAVYSKLCQ
ncbi:MAG: glycosyltransferase, exosortase A system-associated [Methylicorpusculum sp.]|uniref:TIGR04063 family PEP-CTERM/XrtA system glycosyltransferase n=1 Tax=Methylicorpusculum sp. TaxID=2713644 RepID=UPI002720165D|nr:TIGR04063 family PEP-CTERM/XrtA system glycosyltransferase [Methylicorpusculum sp.]MDO8938550.1 glycosyltransferase, exosortase A system-associated [Methylicorpusculum sp.]MDP2202100.1 glycosyltransferase, exosortase A system-associated [Methylicorpusculum sp.]